MLFAASHVNSVWHDAATDVVWRCPPSRTLHHLRTGFAVKRRSFYAAKNCQLGPNAHFANAHFANAHFAELDCVWSIPLPRLGRLGIISGIRRRMLSLCQIHVSRTKFLR